MSVRRSLNNIKTAQKIALERNGKCLSGTFIDKKHKLEWECSFSHKWFASLDSVKYRNHWCPECKKGSLSKKLKLRNGLEIAQKIAIDNNGRCLSEIYENARVKMYWECFLQHRWWASLDKIKNKNQWCPGCSASKTQKLLANIIKEIFPRYNVYFNYKDFNWLKTKGTGKQELDIYIPELKLAIEYDGEQHFQPIKFYGGLGAFEKRKELDKIKNEKIKQHSDDINFFTRFNYRNNITKEYVINTLIKIGAII